MLTETKFNSELQNEWILLSIRQRVIEMGDDVR